MSTVFILSAIKRIKKAFFFMKAVSLRFKSESISYPYLNHTTSFENTLSVLHQVKKITVSIENERCDLQIKLKVLGTRSQICFLK